MEQSFASPAKRQRLCAEPGMDSGLMHSKAASHLKAPAKRSSMLTPQKQGAPDHGSQLHTPDAKRVGAGGDSSVSAEASLLSLSPQALTPNLMVLNQVLGALYVTLPMVRARGRATTFNNVRGPVQNFCGRDFQVRHVQQIKALCPEALGWEHILALNPATRRQEQQLVITMPKAPADTTRLQQQFFASLQQRQAAAGPKASLLELPLAELPPPAGPNARDCTPSRQRAASLLPCTPQTAPPAGHASSLLLSPPPKSAAAVARSTRAASRGDDGSAPPHGLMSPPPARGARSNAAAASASSAADSSAFTFSPAPRQQPHALLSPRGEGGPRIGGGSSLGGALFGTPSGKSSATRAPAAAAAAAAVEAGSSTPSARPSRLFDTPVASATPAQLSAARPNTAATPDGGGGRVPAAAAGVKVRRLTFDVAAPPASKSRAAKAAAAGGGGGGEEVAAQAEPAAAAVANPPSRTKSGIKFELGASTMALLQQVSSAEVKQAEVDERAELDQQRALDMLPGSFEALRAVFGDRGPCVKPQAEVVSLLRQKSAVKGGMSPADAAEQLELLLRLVPEFVRTVTASGTSLAAVSQQVRVNRQVGWLAARSKLVAAVAEARSVGCRAGAAAVKAEQAAAAAATEAAAEDTDSECEEQADMADGDDEGADLLLIERRPASASAAAASAALAQAVAAAAAAAAAVDELDANTSTCRRRSSKARAPAADAGDDLLSLLGPASGGGSTAVMPGAVVSALAFSAPPRRKVTAVKRA